MNNKISEGLENRMNEILDRLEAMKPGSDDYAKVLEDLQNVHKMLETEYDMASKERKLELEEMKAKMELQMKELECDQKNKESKRITFGKIIGTFAAVLFGVGVAYCEESKIIPKFGFGVLNNLFRDNRF